ncbi:MAG: ATP-binding protein [Rhodospirillaceae bacterium]|nr:ATP-binding protein [Rhodospirillaceae bacterium]
MPAKKSKKTPPIHPLHGVLTRIADELARIAPEKAKPAPVAAVDAFVWHPDRSALAPVQEVSRVPLELLKGIGRQADTLLANTRRHAQGLPANNALLWGARGTGKSSLVKAVHAAVNDGAKGKNRLSLVEIHREDIPTLPALLGQLRDLDRKFILLCDDLSFDAQDTSYKALKSVLDGGIEGRPGNVVFYATSNRRHLMARDMIDNERVATINSDEAIQEKVSLSDRFGLWLGFHNVDQDTYLEMITSYAAALKLPIKPEDLRARAIEWQMTRGARSGRVAWQFIQDVAGELGVKIKL